MCRLGRIAIFYFYFRLSYNLILFIVDLIILHCLLFILLFYIVYFIISFCIGYRITSKYSNALRTSQTRSFAK
jgi:hypothetical protein